MLHWDKQPTTGLQNYKRAPKWETTNHEPSEKKQDNHRVIIWEIADHRALKWEIANHKALLWETANIKASVCETTNDRK